LKKNNYSVTHLSYRQRWGHPPVAVPAAGHRINNDIAHAAIVSWAAAGRTMNGPILMTPEVDDNSLQAKCLMKRKSVAGATHCRTDIVSVAMVSAVVYKLLHHHNTSHITIA